MPLIYKPYQATLANKEGQKLYYPRLVKFGKMVNTQKMAELIAEKASLTAGDVHNVIQYFHDVLYRLLIGAELGFTASRLICRNFMFGYRGWSRRADDCEYIGRCYVLAYRYAVYPALCGIYHLHRFLGTSADQQQDNQSERTLKKIR